MKKKSNVQLTTSAMTIIIAAIIVVQATKKGKTDQDNIIKDISHEIINISLFLVLFFKKIFYASSKISSKL